MRHELILICLTRSSLLINMTLTYITVFVETRVTEWTKKKKKNWQQKLTQVIIRLFESHVYDL